MTDHNEEVVKAFLEMKGFFVRTNVRYYVKEEGKPGGNSDVDLVGINPNAKSASAVLPFELRASDFDRIRHLALEVKGWHSENVTPSTLISHGRIFNFTREAARNEVAKKLGTNDFRVILVISSFGTDQVKKAETIDVLKKGGIDHVLEFATIMQALKDGIDDNLNQDSLVMHSFRLAKIYGGASK